MPFDPETKARMFIKSARICCLCYKQCGTNIEAAHIISEKDGGSNDDDNGIPLCFDDHQEVGAYDNSHPKGNKFTPQELKARRDKVYALVDSGFLQAQIIINRIRIDSPKSIPPLIDNSTEYKPSKDVKEVLKMASLSDIPYETFPYKLKLLNKQEQAYIIDSLVDDYDYNNNIEILLTIISNDKYSDDYLVILEQLLRRVSISTSIQLKKKFLQSVSPKLLSNVDEGLRITFFTEVIGILEMHQFKDVNKLTPVLPKVQDSIPQTLLKRYLEVLLSLAKSDAYDARPAAQKTLFELPVHLINYLFEIIDDKFLFWHRDKYYKELISHYKTKWEKSRKELYSDFVTLNARDFFEKWEPDDL